MTEFDLPFPVKGLNDDVAFTDQPSLTTREALNMRGLDPKTGRERGAQRAGLSKYNAERIGSTATTNLLGAESEFDNAVWIKSNVNVVTGQADPASGTLADQLTNTTAGDNSDKIYQELQVGETRFLGQKYEFSVYVKKDASHATAPAFRFELSSIEYFEITVDIGTDSNGGIATLSSQVSQGETAYTVANDVTITSEGGGAWWKVLGRVVYHGLGSFTQDTSQARFTIHPRKVGGVEDIIVYKAYIQEMYHPKVQHLSSITYDNPNVTWNSNPFPYVPAAPDTLTTADNAEWSATTPNGGTVYGLATDIQENLYAIDNERGVVKYNSTGKELWAFQPELLPDQKIHALVVDPLSGVYVGISVSADEEEASIFRYNQVDDEIDEDVITKRTELHWKIQPGGIVKHMAYKNGRLYCAIDIVSKGKSEIVVYTAIQTAVPLEEQRYEVPHPVNHVEPDKSGSTYVSCPRNTKRGFSSTRGTPLQGINPSSTGSSHRTVSWTPKDLESWKQRIWSWYDATDIGTESILEEGGNVSTWQDKSGHGRHLYKNNEDAEVTAAPTYVKEGWAGMPAVRFDGNTQGLMSAMAGTNSLSQADAQKSSIPVYEGAAYAMFVVVRPTRSTNDTSPEGDGEGCIFGHLTRKAVKPGTASTLIDSNGVDLTLNANAAYQHDGATSCQPGRITYHDANVGGFMDTAETSYANDVAREEHVASSYSSSLMWSQLSWDYSERTLTSTVSNAGFYVGCKFIITGGHGRDGAYQVEAFGSNYLGTSGAYWVRLTSNLVSGSDLGNPASGIYSSSSYVTGVRAVQGKYLPSNSSTLAGILPGSADQVSEAFSRPSNDTSTYGSNEDDWDEDKHGVVLISIINDGGLDPQLAGDGTSINNSASGVGVLTPDTFDGVPEGKTRSLWRINGRPMDRWTSNQIKSGADSRSKFGYYKEQDEHFHFEGDILEVIVLDRKDRDSLTEPKILTHPTDPDYLKVVGTPVSGGSGYTPGDVWADIISVGSSGGEGEQGGHPCQPRVGSALYYYNTAVPQPYNNNYRSHMKIGTYDTAGAVTLSTTSGWGWQKNPWITFTANPVGGSGATASGVGDAGGVSAEPALKIHDPNSDTELERIEGYLAHKWGAAHCLPALKKIEDESEDDVWQHPYYKVPPLRTGESDPSKLHATAPILAKFNAGGKLVWTNNTSDFIGHAALLSPVLKGSPLKQYLYSFGNETDGTAEGAAETTGFKEITNLNTDPPTVVGGRAEAGFYDSQVWRPSIDNFASLHVPYIFANKTAVANKTYNFHLFSTTSSVTKNWEADDNSTTGSLDGYARDALVTTPSRESKGFWDGTSLQTYTNNRAVSVYIGTSDVASSGVTGKPNIYKMTLVDSKPNAKPPRTTVLVGVSDGEIKKVTAGAYANITTGDASPDLSAVSTYVSSTNLYGEMFLNDGDKVLAYNPLTDTIENLKPVGAGELPDGAALISSWRGRLILARDRDDPQMWSMSAMGNARDWDMYPEYTTSTQAISGLVARAGKVPDIINTLIPYNDDLLLFGCDHSIWRLTGDPMAGGQFDLVSDVTGMSFGDSWCKDPSGRIYFSGSRGAIYIMAPGGIPERLTKSSIEKRLQDIDFTKYRIKLVWDYLDEGLHVFQVPYGIGGTSVKHWFFDEKRAAWWEDEFGATDVQPTAVHVLDGDNSGDRVLLLGGEDSFIRKWDLDASSDDSNAIDAHFLLGPLTPRGTSSEIRFSHLTPVLADDQDGARFEIFAADVPDTKGEALVSGTLTPGRNQTNLSRVRGSYAWVRFRNAANGQRFAYESSGMRANQAGRKRIRL